MFTSTTRLPRLLEPAPLQDLSPIDLNNDSADGNHHPLFRCTHTSSRPYLCPRNIRRNPHHVVPMFLRVPLPVRDEQPPHQHSHRLHNLDESAAQVVRPYGQEPAARMSLPCDLFSNLPHSACARPSGREVFRQVPVRAEAAADAGNHARVQG